MWTAILNILVGLWLMVSPAFLDMSKPVADNNQVTGPLIITFAVISLWEINRNVIKANVVLGVWLFAAFFIFSFSNTEVIISNTVCGMLTILLSLVKRKSVDQYGGGWSSLFQYNPPHMHVAEKRSARTES
jgi:hypothetical protein